MKKIISLLSLIFIFNIAPLNAMKRTHEQLLTSTTDATQAEFWLPDEIITKIAVDYCEPKERMLASLVNTHLNKLTAITKKDGEISINKAHRLFYLFYGCIHDLGNLVTNALKVFDLEEKWIDRNEKNGTELIAYPEKIILNSIKYQIKKLINAKKLPNSCIYEFLPEYLDLTVTIKMPFLHWVIKYNDLALFTLLLKKYSSYFALQATDGSGASALGFLLEQNPPTKEQSAMMNLLLNDPRTNLGKEKLPDLISESTLLPKIIKMKFALDDIDVNEKDEQGYAALHHASYMSPQAVQLLLTHSDSDINIADPEGRTPLHYAVFHINIDEFYNPNSIKCLTADDRCDVNRADRQGKTPAHRILEKHNHPMDPLKLLLRKRNININLQDNNDDTLLHIAVRKNQLQAVEFLLKNSKIDTGLINKQKRTPLMRSQYAIEEFRAKLESCGTIEESTRIKESLETAEAIYNLINSHNLIKYCSSPTSATYKTLHGI